MITGVCLKRILLSAMFLFPCLMISQEKTMAEEIFSNYEEYREPALTTKRFKQEDILPLIERFKEEPGFTVTKVGESIEGRDLQLISLGKGKTDVLLWSQMHGNESTATMATFDLLNFFTSEGYEEQKEQLLENTTLHFLPMLNPDGAEVFERRNALGVDVNRDALRLQTPEGRALKRVRDSLDADFGFNLHDQSRYYNTAGSAKPATISFLAPAYNEEKSINEKRGEAMKLIVDMNQVLQKYIPGQIGRYDDTFEPRAFGDNIQKWGTRTILIESGGHYDDPEKQEIRKLNFLGILSALLSISNQDYLDQNIQGYSAIPQNESRLYDLKLTNVKYFLLGKPYQIDLGINLSETTSNGEVYYRGRIADIGDLSTNHAYQSEEVSGYTLVPGAIYPKTLADIEELETLDFSSLLEQGYAYVRVLDLPKEQAFAAFPIQVIGPDYDVDFEMEIGANPTFFLENGGKLKYAVINGFFLNPEDLEELQNKVNNGLILR